MAHTSGHTSQETTRRSEPAIDAVDLLLEQHAEVRALFQKIRKAEGEACKRLVNEVSDKLITHSQLEEKIFYPAMREVDSEMVSHSFREHEEADRLLFSLSDLSYLSPGFQDKVNTLLESIEHHVKEEEKTLLPEARRSLDNLGQMGEEMQDLMRRVDAGHIRNAWHKSGGPH